MKNKEKIDFYINVYNENVKILQLSDTQIIDSSQIRFENRLSELEAEKWKPENMNKNLFDHIDYLVKHTNPDLIIIAGDLAYGEFDDIGSSQTALIKKMDSYKIPWCLVFGNHDNETKMGVDWQVQQYKNSEYGLFKRGEVSGNSNYTVGIKQKGILKRVIYLLDTHGTNNIPTINRNKVINEIGFKSDQIEWLINSFKSTNNTKGIAIWHIPSIEFEQGLIEKFNMPKNLNYSEGFKIKSDENEFGQIGDMFHNAFKTNGLINTLRKCQIDNVFVGHVHKNNTSIIYKDIRWTFGLKTGYYDGYNKDQTGGTLITINKDNKIKVKHIYYNNKDR